MVETETNLDSDSESGESSDSKYIDSMLYLLKMSRPRFWMYLAGPVLVGATFGSEGVENFLSPITASLFIYFLIPANVLLYGVNDIFDSDVDEHNPKKDEKEVRYRGDTLTIGAVLLSGLLGFTFIPFLNFEALIAFTGFYFLAVEYSAPPLRFKTTPVFDSVSNGLYILPGVVAYAELSGTFPPMLSIGAGWLWTMAMHTFSAIPDIEPDKEAGIETTATFLGETRSYTYCGLCWIGSAVLFLLVHPVFGVILSVYPLLVASIATSNVSVDRAYWWFPFINVATGAAFTMTGLWVLMHT